MRTCFDCVYVARRNRVVFDMKCKRTKAIRATGTAADLARIPPATMMDCVGCRSNEEVCGRDGKWFKPRILAYMRGVR